MDDEFKRRTLRRVWHAVSAVLASPTVWISILGILGTLLGMLASRLSVKHENEVATEKRQADEAATAAKQGAAQANDTNRVNQEIDKQREADKNWNPDAPPPVVPR